MYGGGVSKQRKKNLSATQAKNYSYARENKLIYQSKYYLNANSTKKKRWCE